MQWAYIQSPAPLSYLYRAIQLLIRISAGAERKLQELLSVLWVSVSEICKDAEEVAQCCLFKYSRGQAQRDEC